MDDSNKTNSESEGPPLFGSWKRVYWFVALFFAIEVVVFYLFTRLYS